jgi:hypothetical protein
MHLLRALATAALLLTSAPAFAATVFQVIGWDLGETVRVTFDGQARSFTTARFHEIVDGVAGTSFCADLVQYLGAGTYTDFAAYDPANAETQPLAAGPPARAFVWAAQIVDRWGNDLGVLASQLGVTQVQAITGVQAAVWEAVYGDAFAATSSSMSANAFRVFNYVLGARYSGYGDTRLYHSQGRQDQLFTPPVPEPSAMLVFGAGALLLAGALRRRA